MKGPDHWSPSHPVAHAIAGGSRWLDAWIAQKCTPWPQIEKRAGIGASRLGELTFGNGPTEAEVASLASLWNLTVSELRASIHLSEQGHLG
jgi:hypothetical protein